MAGKVYTKKEMVRSIIAVIIGLLIVVVVWKQMSTKAVDDVINSIEVSGKYFSNKLIDEMKKDFEDKENIDFSIKAVEAKLQTKAIDEVKKARNTVSSLEKKIKELNESKKDKSNELKKIPSKLAKFEEELKKAVKEDNKDSIEKDIKYLSKREKTLKNDIEEIGIMIPKTSNDLEKAKKELEIVEKRKIDSMLKYSINENEFENISSMSIDNIAIWSKNDDVESEDKVINEFHTLSKLKTLRKNGKTIKAKNLYGVDLGEKVDKKEVKNFFKLKIENEIIENKFDNLKGYFIEDIKSVLKNKNRETIHALSKFSINDKEYVLDIQYSKRSVKENKIERQIQKITIVLIGLFLLYLFVYSLFMDKNLLMHVLIVYVLIFTLYPLTWVMSLTFKSNNSLGGTSLNPIPENPTLDNYKLTLFNKKKLKEEGLILEKFEENGVMKAQLLVAEEVNRNATEFAIVNHIISEYNENEEAILNVGDKNLEENYKKIQGYIVEAKKESKTAYKKYRDLEKTAKKAGKLINGYSAFSDIKKSGKIVSKEYKNALKYAKRIQKSIKKAEKKYSGNKDEYEELLKNINNFARMIKDASLRFDKLGQDYVLKITGNDVKTVYNVFDKTQKNIYAKESVNLVIKEIIKEVEYEGETVEIIKNQYYIKFATVPNIELGDEQQIYNVEYYTKQNALFVSGMANSLFVAILTSLLGMMLSSAAAYAFSRFRFPGRDGFMMSFLVTQMFPNIMMLIPLYIIFGNLGLINTFRGLILAYSITALPFNIWNLKGFFDTVPKDLEEAALIDGCSASQTFYKIVLPLSLPSLAISGLFSFMGAWNEYIIAATFMNEESRYTIPVVIKMLVSSNSVDWPMFATMSVLVSIPVVIVFMMTQKYLVGGLTAGGVKG